MKLYFVRHGQTYLNKYKRMQGWADAPLTPEGEMVALKTGEVLSALKFDAVYTSDLGRTQQTAKLILSKNTFSDSIVPLSELRESCFGSFEGEQDLIFYTRVAEKHGISLKEVFTTLDLETISSDMLEMDDYKDVELFSKVLERVLRGLRKIVSSQQENDSILIVTHGNIIRALVKHFSPEINVMTEIKNSSITIINFSNDQFSVEAFNQ